MTNMQKDVPQMKTWWHTFQYTNTRLA